MRVLHINEFIYNRTDKVGDCLIYNGKQIAKNGYVRLSTNSHFYNKLGERSLHRIIWTIFNGTAIPANLVIMHTCDNKLCLNPSHLKLGTVRENVLDKYTKQRNVDVRGMKNPQSKLADDKVLLIRELEGEFSANFLAEFFSVNPRHIRSIWTKESWSHL